MPMTILSVQILALTYTASIWVIKGDLLMSIAKKVSAYLDQAGINYQLLNHSPSSNSLSSALQSNLSTSQIVKAVVLEDIQGGKLMAILPASHKISLRALNENFNRQFHIVKESHIYELFDDCKHGAVPPIAQVYELDRVYDECLLLQDTLYLEGGDHATLIKLSQDDFRKLLPNAPILRFSYQLFQ